MILIFIDEPIYAQFDNKSQLLLNAKSAKYSKDNLYSGAVGIQNDLGSLKGFNNTEIPVFITYNTGGIKVQDHASIVGTGWQINVVSFISRNVIGSPDEKPTNGYFGGAKGLVVDGPMPKDTALKVESGEYDTEPDDYYLNLNGVSLKFRFNKNGIPSFINTNDYSFIKTPFQVPVSDEWIVKDIFGNKYVFGGSSSFIESMSTSEKTRNLPINKNFVATWYLKEINLYESHETITYDYIQGAPITYKRYSYKKVKAEHITKTSKLEKKLLWFTVRRSSTEVSTNPIINQEWDSGIEYEISSPKYLKTITSSIQKVDFSYGQDRLDLLGGYFLKDIVYQNLDNTQLKKYKFNTSYKQASPFTSSSPDSYRLYLNSIELIDKAGNESIKLYSYTYNSTSLPPRNSDLTDHWGYYSINGSRFPTHLSNNKLPNSENSKAGSLEKIQFHTGGYTKYTFENNQYYDGNKKINQIAGGLRIAKIEEFENENTLSLSTSYRYVYDDNKSTGKLGLSYVPYSYKIDNELSRSIAFNTQFSSINILPGFQIGGGSPSVIIDTFAPIPPYLNNSIYSFPGANSFFQNANLQQQVAQDIIGLFRCACQTSSITTDFTITSSVPFINMSEDSYSKIGYSEVTIVKENNGKEVLKFTDIVDYPDSFLQFVVGGDGKQKLLGNKPYFLTPMSPPFTPTTSKEYARGLLKEVLTYNNSNVLVDKIVNQYEERTFGEPINGLRVFLGKIKSTTFNVPSNEFAFQGENVYFNIGYYSVLRKQMILQSSNKILPINEVINYTYDSIYPSLLINEVITNSDNKIYTSRNIYVKNSNEFSFNTTDEIAGLNLLKSNNQWGVKIGEVKKINNQNIDELKIGYKVSNSTSFPFNIYKKSTGDYEFIKQSINYDLQGRMINYIDELSRPVTLIYQNNTSNNLKNKLLNCNHDEFFFENFESVGNNTDAHTGNKGFSGSYTPQFTPVNQRKYVLSYWYKDNGKWKFSGLLTFSSQTISGIIDDVSIHPIDAACSSYLFDESSNLKSEINSSHKTIFYEYDNFHRLKTVRDSELNIIKSINYNYRAIAP
jgi:hypothetical protein